jgi:hypothetical protein
MGQLHCTNGKHTQTKGYIIDGKPTTPGTLWREGEAPQIQMTKPDGRQGILDLDNPLVVLWTFGYRPGYAIRHGDTLIRYQGEPVYPFQGEWLWHSGGEIREIEINVESLERFSLSTEGTVLTLPGDAVPLRHLLEHYGPAEGLGAVLKKLEIQFYDHKGKCIDTDLAIKRLLDHYLLDQLPEELRKAGSTSKVGKRHTRVERRGLIFTSPEQVSQFLDAYIRREGAFSPAEDETSVSSVPWQVIISAKKPWDDLKKEAADFFQRGSNSFIAELDVWRGGTPPSEVALVIERLYSGEFFVKFYIEYPTGLKELLPESFVIPEANDLPRALWAKTATWPLKQSFETALGSLVCIDLSKIKEVFDANPFRVRVSDVSYLSYFVNRPDGLRVTGEQDSYEVLFSLINPGIGKYKMFTIGQKAFLLKSPGRTNPRFSITVRSSYGGPITTEPLIREFNELFRRVCKAIETAN